MPMSKSRTLRLKKIMEEAVEQSGNNIVPEIIFKEKLEVLEGNNLFCHTVSENSLKISEVNFPPTNKFLGKKYSHV